MMPLAFSDPDEVCTIRRITGKPEMKKHLEDMGFVVGGDVSIVSKVNDSVIVNVKNTRIAISAEMAMKIYI